MYRVFQSFVDGLTESFDERGLCQAMAAIASHLDLICFAYLELPTQPKREPRLISNYPAAWTTHYLHQHYERVDPVILTALKEREPFEWGPDIGPRPLSSQQRHLFADAACFGIRHGFTIPIHDGKGPIAAVTYASQERSSAFQVCIERNARVLQLVALYFHVHARRKLAGDRIVDGVMLTPREFECLQWAARGKSAWDIAQILGVSRRTAAFHLDNARAKLSVRTVCQAVARIAASGVKQI